MPHPAGDLFSPLRNRSAFSGHWLDEWLPREPEWGEQEPAADAALDALVTLWAKRGQTLDKLGNEQSLEHAFVQPVLDALGWRVKYQTQLQGRKPDYALFLTDADYLAALDAGDGSEGFWQRAAVVADAKRWELSLDKPTGKGAAREYPPEQIEWYLDRSRKPFGVLTNGRHWRLVPRELAGHQRRYQTYLEVDLAALLTEAGTGLLGRANVLDDFRRFFLLFGPPGYATPDDRKPLHVRAVEGSSEYRLGVSEDLKAQAFEALRLCVEGFLLFPDNKLDPGLHLEGCRENGFTLLCRLLFVMYAEDRRLLPYRTHPLYTSNRSLGRLRDDIAGQLDKAADGRGDDFSRTDAGLWQHLAALFDLIDNGHPPYKVPAYNGGLFKPTNHPFLTENTIGDWHLARVIDRLSRATGPQDSRPRFRVDYRDLALQHLGGVYEGLLELRPRWAAVPVRVCRKVTKGVAEERYVPQGEPPPAGFVATGERFAAGGVYLDSDKGERRAFGSYYTPDHVVRHIVERAVGPLCDELEAAAAADPAGTPFPDRVLALKVVDPSMGSGHFLLAACQYLAERIATSPHTADADPTLGDWKRRVSERCLYGVDLNPLAVDLGKLAVWLETVSRDRPLTFLNHQLRHGNSLIGAGLGRLAALHDAPKLAVAGFAELFEERLPAIRKPLDAIRALESDTIKLVEKKEQRHAEYEKAVRPFRRLADVWAADATGTPVDATTYAEAARRVHQPKAFAEYATAHLAAAEDAARRLVPFHWELAFPEVFAAGGGFDAVIGNPPYEVLSEKESGTDPAALKAFVSTDPLYEPAVRGKQNLYKLFVCRGAGLLRDGGRFGFIVPMALLGDDQARGVRQRLATAGHFAAVEAFPQKDNPRTRIFADAKLSTVVFVWVKGGAAAGHPFRSNLYRANVFDQPLASLTLTTADVPLYDPDNLSVVSCGQEDWDLAVRLMKSGRMGRLGEFAAFSQGEVNETIQRAAGTLLPSGAGKLVKRGAGITLYAVRPASQGEDLYLNVPAFLADKDPASKAFHHKHARVGVQESAPQNNFRRLIAAPIPAGEFCNHTINYAIVPNLKLPLPFVLGLLNSELADWYFRIGSTNAHVSHYQLHNLPCPRFRTTATADESAVGAVVAKHLGDHRPDKALVALAPLLVDAPFSPAVRDTVVDAVGRIVAIESARGEMSRTDRSALSAAAQPFQDFLDAVFYRLAGLTAAEVAGLLQRYADMKKVK